MPPHPWMDGWMDGFIYNLIYISYIKINIVQIHKIPLKTVITSKLFGKTDFLPNFNSPPRTYRSNYKYIYIIHIINIYMYVFVYL